MENMVFQLAILIGIPIILGIVIVSPFDEPIEEEPELIPENISAFTTLKFKIPNFPSLDKSNNLTIKINRNESLKLKLLISLFCCQK